MESLGKTHSLIYIHKNILVYAIIMRDYQLRVRVFSFEQIDSLVTHVFKCRPKNIAAIP